MAPTSSLNPDAACFVPACMRPSMQQDMLPGRHWDDLPTEVTTSIITHMTSPADIMSCALACKPLLAQVSNAPLTLDFSGGEKGAKPQHMQLSSPASPRLAQMVVQLPKVMPGAVLLDLAGLPLEDEDVGRLVAGLPRLRHLELAACRRITPGFVRGLVRGRYSSSSSATATASSSTAASSGSATAPASSGSASSFDSSSETDSDYEYDTLDIAADDSCSATLHVSETDSNSCSVGSQSAVSTGRAAGAGGMQRGSALCVLNLQRCFQLDAGSLSQLLVAVGHGNCQLETLALSHLDLCKWPWHPNYPPPTTTTATDSTTPQTTQENDSFLSALSTALRPATKVVSGSCSLVGLVAPAWSLTVLALNNCSGVTVTGLAAVATLCPGLQFLMLGGCDLTLAGSVSSSGAVEPEGGPQQLQEPLLPRVVGRLLPELRQAVAHYEPLPFPAGAQSHKVTPIDHPWMREVAACVSATLLTLTLLRAVELTFLPQPVLARVAEAMRRRLAKTGRAPQVWDLTQPQSVKAALSTLRELRGAGPAGTDIDTVPGVAAGTLAAPAAEASLRLALRCAANCSNGARVAPAHMVSWRGDATALVGLLQLGSGLDSKDRAGATPLFLACETGHDECVRVLLEQGADAQLANSAGELPLYIAALRGHSSVVTLLLNHFGTCNIPWMDAHLYTDHWTPLMAAALADRHDIAQALLHAANAHLRHPHAHQNGTTVHSKRSAGSSTRSGSGGQGAGAAALVRAVNRYGQSVLHISARKGSPRMLRLLLGALHEDTHTSARHSHSHSRCCACLTLPDSNGDTPVDVARKSCNVQALQELTRPLTAHHHHHPGAPHPTAVNPDQGMVKSWV